MYGNVRMTKEVAEILKIQKQEEMLAKVHEYCTQRSTLSAPPDHQYIQTAAEAEGVIEHASQKTDNIPLLDADKIVISGKGQFDDTVWDDAIFDEGENITGFKNQPNLKVFISRDRIDEAMKSMASTEENVTVNISASDIPASVEEVVTATEEKEKEEDKIEMQCLPQVHKTKKKNKQPSV